MPKSETKSRESDAFKGRLKRFLPLLVLAAAIALFFLSGLHKALTFDAIAASYGELTGRVAENPALSGLAALAIYALAVALSFPAAWLLTVAAGLVFGWFWGGLLVLFGATLGAAALYLIARYALADFFRQRAGGLLNRMADGFRRDAVSYMLFLRLAPVFPFTLVNVVSAILGVAFPTYLWTTFVGIIPGVAAYAFAGEGLRSIVHDRAAACAAGIPPCGTPLTAGDVLTPEIGIAFLALAVVSLIPVVLKRRMRTGKI